MLDAVPELGLVTAVDGKGHQLVDSGRSESQLAASFSNLCSFLRRYMMMCEDGSGVNRVCVEVK